MAKREELQIIRSARAGEARAQLALGRRYLFGGGGLPVSTETALYWLDRAAQQEQSDAWMLIGSHIPFEVAEKMLEPDAVVAWYERAFDAGVVEAGLVLARLIFSQSGADIAPALKHKAWRALEEAACAGIADAQWLLAQQIGIEKKRVAVGMPSAAGNTTSSPQVVTMANEHAMLKWATVAAESGVLEAQFALADHAWAIANHPLFLQRALPLARLVAHRAHGAPAYPAEEMLSHAQSQLLYRCAQAMMGTPECDEAELVHYLDLAAQAGNRDAQLSLGLWHARIDAAGMRTERSAGVAHYKKSIRWLTMAGEAGLSSAWYALSKIFVKPEFSQRNRDEAQRYLMRAARAGHCKAQLDLGISAWRMRRHDESADIRAAYWLQKAAAQGSVEASTLSNRCAAPPEPAAWAANLCKQLRRESIRLYPFLAARIELAAVFGLSPPEALLIDVNNVDLGHCLLIDIRGEYARAKRRLISVQTGEQRQALGRITRLFEDVDCSAEGPEGNYRQRLYRLRSLKASISSGRP